MTTGHTPWPGDDENPPRAVVITGASSGIGLATAERLARAGHLVVLGARRTDICEDAAARLRAEGASAFAVPLDLADTRSIGQFVDAARYLVGTVDVLVSNADASRPLLPAAADPTTIRSIVDLGLLGAQQLTAQLIPAMIDKGGGDLVFVSAETVGERPRPGTGAHPACRHALQTWAAVLHTELEGTGVRVSVVRPGPAGYPSGWNWADAVEMPGVWQREGITRHRNLWEPGEIARVVTSILGCPQRMPLRLVEVVPPGPRTKEVTH
ncbi:SDR family NAD(P)-dependent oxidoreductase [Mycobacterium botniense]|uniref:SDR family NAD(P)-dependent oxidoreductase n=1 Tax=Mycobacterium botniense TaxID=84962 RepID=UPI0013D08D1C|nr:SDR family NAD(P)-dependent oxidoreductase [Mycobacterium botniense]